MEHDLYLMYNFNPYNVLLAIATNEELFYKTR